MPRNGAGVASPIPGFNTVAASTTILSALHNSGINDIFTILNSAWPVSLGGTGGSTSITSWDAITAKGTDIPSASTIVLTTATGPRIDITGVTAITAVTLANGSMRIARATGIFVLTASATLIVNKSTTVNYTTAVGDLMIFTAEGGVTSVTVIGSSSSSNTTSNASFINLSLVASVAASALTVAIKGVDGNDPSASNPVIISFRSATAGSGAVAQLTLTAATSLVISSGSTLGSTSAVAATYAIGVFNDAGTARIGIINPLTLPVVDGIFSSILEAGIGAADSAGVIYTSTGSAVTSKAFTFIGYITATEATAGTWATAPSTVQVGPAPAVANALPLITPWVAYTPTFTGFGTVTAINMFSRRFGDTLQIRGGFTTGTTTATEARMTLGFNGTNSNVTSSTTKVPILQLAGDVAAANAGTALYYALIESAIGYCTFGDQTGTTAGLSKANGNVFQNSTAVSVLAEIPIQGW